MKAFIERARRTAVELERMLDERINTLVRTTPRGLEPLEVRHAVLDEIESRLVPGPDGTRVFPYDEVDVQLIGRNPDDVAALEATLASHGGLAAAARARLAHHGCHAHFEVHVATVADPAEHTPIDAGTTGDATAPANTYRLVFRRRAAATTEPPTLVDTPLTLTLAAAAESIACTLASGRLDVGRVADVRDRDGRLVRQNRLVIPESLDPNGTVSRRHAHLTVTRAGALVSYRVFDDGSRYGTSIVRHGRTIAVHAGSLGVALRDGDEVRFGDVAGLVRIAG